jgi:hypothetical protein
MTTITLKKYLGIAITAISLMILDEVGREAVRMLVFPSLHAWF